MELLEKELRIPIEIRNPFQIYLMKEMGVKHGDIDKEIIWAEKYGKKISDIIDNLENSKIREHILSGNFKEAIKQIYEKL